VSTIDLNADLGEGVGADPASLDAGLLRLITSANVACGGHAGDRESMTRVCALAAEYGVAVGAQVSYLDLEGFGRRRLDISPSLLTAQLIEQVEALDEIAAGCGTRVTYVKPHGALYNSAADDDVIALAVASAVSALNSATKPGLGAGLALLGLAGSRLDDAAGAHGLAYVPEGFADRAYTASGRLVPRDVDGAVLHDHLHVAAQAVRIALDGEVVSIDGSVVAVVARSLCVHGDTPDAVRLLQRVRDELWVRGLTLSAFAPPPGRGDS
jgi:UPF0271 protein